MAVDREKGPPSLLELLDAGEIDVDTYIDRKVEAATTHLPGLTEAELRHVRALLRAQIAEEPELRELVRRATGRT
jgi:hypothetical protein